jgi:hypothetical protein
MKIVVIGGTGLIGSKTVAILRGTYCFRSQILLYMKDEIERVHGTVWDRRSL